VRISPVQRRLAASAFWPSPPPVACGRRDCLGRRLDADIAHGEYLRIVQFTPPDSGCSIQFGANITSDPPGSAQGLYLVVPDIEAARRALPT
jgi:hypothetical protein